MMNSGWLEHLKGDADGLRRLADALDMSAEKIGAMSRTLGHFKTGTVWDSPAGAEFQARIQLAPVQLERLARRYRGAASAARELAPVLEDTQRRVTAAIEDHWPARRRADDTLRQLDLATDDATRARLHQANIAETERCNVLEAAYSLAWDEFRAADRRCAARLRELAEDALDDPWHYTTMVVVGDAGRTLGEVPAVGPLAAVSTVGDVLAATSDVTLYAAYDEGSLEELAINAASYAAPVGGQMMRKTAVNGVRRAKVGEGRVDYQTSGKWSIKDSRRAGARTAIEQRNDITRWLLADPRAAVKHDPLPKIPAPVLKNRSNAQRTAALRDYARASAKRGLENAFLKDFRLASANGPSATRLYGAGAVLDKGQKTYNTAVKVKDTAVKANNYLERRASGEPLVVQKCNPPAPGGIPGAGLP